MTNKQENQKVKIYFIAGAIMGAVVAGTSSMAFDGCPGEVCTAVTSSGNSSPPTCAGTWMITETESSALNGCNTKANCTSKVRFRFTLPASGCGSVKMCINQDGMATVDTACQTTGSFDQSVTLTAPCCGGDPPKGESNNAEARIVNCGEACDDDDEMRAQRTRTVACEGCDTQRGT